MTNDFHSTISSGGQSRLIAAAWEQVAGIRRPAGGSSSVGRREEVSGTLPPNIFPGYRLLGEIHRGGQGVVYKALQESTQRHVAIKVLRDNEWLTAAELARFELEVRILGRLRHANIVRIYDSGAVAGRFHYVMDYIPGLPLDDYFEKLGDSRIEGAGKTDGRSQSKIQNPKSKTDRIVRLLVKICDAVNAAHMRGIIHRDLKPGNIRVDENGEPFVLDFGLSKLTVRETQDMTQTGQFVGSLPWAAPEQAQGRIDAIDLRTDVYSLGMLLYRALTQEFPYSISGGLANVLTQIAHTEPVPPRVHVPHLAADLETIILKCLQKDPERRYQTAGELGRDLERYLAGEPIEARRDSLTYILGKQLARYRAAVFTGVVFLLLIMSAAAVTTFLWREQSHQREAAEKSRAAEAEQRQRAEVNEQLAKRNEERAEAEAAAAKTQAAIAQARNQLLNDMLLAANRGEQQGRADVPVRELLDGLAQKLEDGTAFTGAAFEGIPPQAREQVEAAVRRTIGVTYYNLGLYSVAEPHLQKALATHEHLFGSECLEAASDLNDLAAVLQFQSRLAEAEPLYRRAIAIKRKWLGNEHLEVAAFLNNLAVLFQQQGRLTEAEPLFREVLAMQRKLLGPAHPLPASSLANLASLLKKQGKPAEAEPLFREALALERELHGAEHPQVAMMLHQLGGSLRDQGKLAEAEPLCREALAMRRKLLGEDHPRVADSLNDLALLLKAQDKSAEAESLCREALALRRKLLGNEHLSVAESMNSLASVLEAQGQAVEAESLYRETLALRRKLLGEEHSDIAISLNNLAVFLQEQGRLAEAELLSREALAMWRKLLGDEHEKVAIGLHNLALLLRDQGKPAEAESLFREALTLARKSLNRENPLITTASHNLAKLLLSQNRSTEAEPLFREVLAVFRKQLPAGHVYLAATQTNLGLTLIRLEQYAEAEELLLAAEAAFRAHPRPPAKMVRMTMECLVKLYADQHAAEPNQGYDAKAAAWRAKLDEWRAANQPTAP